ncbi:MAG TPA: hypothetical protein VFX61_12755 [Micromonosporaceae bacterium]|nr:hypothetical protein [Micromonosporaceae bacterium]
MEAVSVGVVILAAIGLAYAVYRVMTGPSVRSAFARAPVTAAADITTPGRYRLTGRVVPVGEPPTSEASGRAYVARDLRIAVSAGDSGSTRGAQEVVDFLLDDGTTRTLVRAESAVVAIDRDFAAPKTTLDQVPWVDALLRAGGYHNGSPSTCTVRLYEGILAPGTHAGVLGHAGPADERASALGATHVVRSQPGAPVMIRAEAPAPPQDT